MSPCYKKNRKILAVSRGWDFSSLGCMNLNRTMKCRNRKWTWLQNVTKILQVRLLRDISLELRKLLAKPWLPFSSWQTHRTKQCTLPFLPMPSTLHGSVGSVGTKPNTLPISAPLSWARNNMSQNICQQKTMRCLAGHDFCWKPPKTLVPNKNGACQDAFKVESPCRIRFRNPEASAKNHPKESPWVKTMVSSHEPFQPVSATSINIQGAKVVAFVGETFQTYVSAICLGETHVGNGLDVQQIRIWWRGLLPAKETLWVLKALPEGPFLWRSYSYMCIYVTYILYIHLILLSFDVIGNHQKIW